jgi:hypothetical protein
VVNTILSDWEGVAKLLPKSHGLLLNPNDIYLEWVKNLHLSGLEEGVPSMGPPSCSRVLGLTPHGKSLGELNHFPGLSGPVERPHLSS